MTTPELRFTPGIILSWDLERGRGVLRADGSTEDVVAHLDAFSGFAVTAHPGLEVEFRRTKTAEGFRALEIRPRAC